MSVKPIDYQVMLPRTTEISRLRDSETHKNQVIAQHQATASEKKADGNIKQVNARKQAEQAAIKEKQREESSKKNNKEEKDNHSEGKIKSIKTQKNTVSKMGSIDIRI